jgi:hypothetical protein
MAVQKLPDFKREVTTLGGNRAAFGELGERCNGIFQRQKPTNAGLSGVLR